MRKKKWTADMKNMRVISVLCIMFSIMQWNARRLIANGQELKQLIDGLGEKPEIICIEETWLKPRVDFIIPGYKCERKIGRIHQEGDVPPLLEMEFSIEE